MRAADGGARAPLGRELLAGDREHQPLDVGECRLLRLRAHAGGVTVHGERDVGFAVQRVYYLYNVPALQARGAHAHLALQQLIVAVSGAFTVELDDGRVRRSVRLDRPDIGIQVAPMIWRDLRDFSADAVCLVLASLPYDEADYVRDYDVFRRAAAG